MNDRPQETVTILALLNLIRLLAAEFVARASIGTMSKGLSWRWTGNLARRRSPRGTDVNDARAGIACARELLRPYVKQVRDQAKIARIRGQHPAALRLSKYLQ